MIDSRTLAVLVVDDDSVVRQVLAAMLASKGYEPLPVAGGGEAVEVCRTRASAVAAVVLDVKMPGMDGPATLDALLAINPTLPCVFVSGHTGEYSETELLARGASAVLNKPVAAAQLGDAVTAAINLGDFGSGPPVG